MFEGEDMGDDIGGSAPQFSAKQIGTGYFAACRVVQTCAKSPRPCIPIEPFSQAIDDVLTQAVPATGCFVIEVFDDIVTR
jgi:hypothetical protein